MNAMAWIAIAAIIIPNAIKAFELYLAHKKQASPNPIENQRSGVSQDRTNEKQWLRLLALTVHGLGIGNSLFFLGYNLIYPWRHSRLLILTTVLQTLFLVHFVRQFRRWLKRESVKSDF